MAKKRLWRALLAASNFLAALGLSHAGAAAACTVETFEGSSFTVCLVDTRHSELRLAWRDEAGKALRTFSRLNHVLGGDARRVEFGMNAGMYEEDGTPIGLLVEDGKQHRPIETRDGDGNFYLKPNGVLSVAHNGTVHVETTEAFAAAHRRTEWATQSGPMLVVSGKLHPRITKDGPSKNIRNAVGIRDAHTALFVISNTPVSFGRLARFLRDGLGCPDALYLDGAISSLWVPSQRRRDQGAELGPMIVVLERSKE
ncbi:MAG TPA: phosphodiester glycosidase family protein [Rhizomicrobium sp.]|nr:phosphodiester glycosidase family protein [Rhizomicrobium sp.]